MSNKFTLLRFNPEHYGDYTLLLGDKIFSNAMVTLQAIYKRPTTKNQMTHRYQASLPFTDIRTTKSISVHCLAKDTSKSRKVTSTGFIPFTRLI